MHLILFEHCSPNTVEIDKSIFGDKSFTTTVNFQFQSESLKNDLVALCFYFFNFPRRTVTSGDYEKSLKISMPRR